MSDYTKGDTPPASFDFEQWAALAATDPEAFEARRRQVLNETIRDLSPGKQKRLRRLQWKLDQVRNTSGNSLAACIRMSRMMWDATLGEGGLLDALDQLGNPTLAHGARRSAKILPFPGPTRQPRLS